MKKLILIFALIINLSAFSQDDKTVTLVVSGQGKTQDEAKQNALRSAIEQAFGTFISSKTEILNDNLVKDEIVSIANGNIQKFDIISEVQIPDGGYASTLKATVSVTKLTSFVESKGVEVEYKGSLFGANIKQQILNEEAEVKAIFEMAGFLHEMMQTSFDYTMKNNQPISLDAENRKWSVPIEIQATCNKNIDNCANFLNNTLGAISLSSSETETYKSLNKKLFQIIVKYQNQTKTYNLRKQISMDMIESLFSNWNFYTRLFAVQNGISENYGMGKSKDEIIFFTYNSKYNKQPSVFINFPMLGNIVRTFSYSDILTIDQIEKISGYSVKPRGIISKFKNGGYVVFEKDGHGLVASIIDIGSFNFYDAKTVCDNLIQFGYSDWQLPTKEQLINIYENFIIAGRGYYIENGRWYFAYENGIGNFRYNKYWGKIEDNEKAWYINFDNWDYDKKINESERRYIPDTEELGVRAVRRF
jgi:hypothetical protein